MNLGEKAKKLMEQNPDLSPRQAIQKAIEKGLII